MADSNTGKVTGVAIPDTGGKFRYDGTRESLEQIATAYRLQLCIAKALLREPRYEDFDRILESLRNGFRAMEERHGMIPEAGFSWRLPHRR